ncbi:MAG: hypothetical protein HY021_03435 [Burkholderiales bacterium]|nr:hypothetical protein [Burkholderiales bacterium]
MVQDLGRRYAGAFNRRHRRVGALWNGRFRSTVVQPGALAIDAMVYVEHSASEDDAHEGAPPNPWSSAPHHLGQLRDGLVSELDAYWRLGNTPFEREAAYARCLADGLSAHQRQRIADAAHKGWPLGDTTFVQTLAEAVDRPVQPRPRGRPARNTPGTA